MQRLVTAAVSVPLALGAVFLLPGAWFFVVVAVLLEAAVAEFVAMVRPLSKRMQFMVNRFVSLLATC